MKLFHVNTENNIVNCVCETKKKIKIKKLRRRKKYSAKTLNVKQTSGTLLIY